MFQVNKRKKVFGNPVSRLLIASASLVLLVLGGCATYPRQIDMPVKEDLRVLQVKRSNDAYVGSRVRWGGIIAKVENRADETWVELVEQPLNRYGRPLETDNTGGRFLAVLPDFVDPTIYKEGRELTVVGVIEKPIEGKIGELTYKYPVVVSQGYYLWPVRQQQRYNEVIYVSSFWSPYHHPFYHHHWHHYPRRVILRPHRKPVVRDREPQFKPNRVEPREPRKIIRSEPKTQHREK